MNNLKRLLKNIILFSIFLMGFSSLIFAHEKQKNLLESYFGKWSGKVTIQIIDKAGGWDNEEFAGFHQITNEVWNLYFDVDFMHPLDDPSVVEEGKKMRMSVENIRNFMPVPEQLNIKGDATVSGVEENTHETKEYCEECRGKDGTTKKEFSPVIISVSGRVDLRKNEINFNFENVPTEYIFPRWFDSENIKFVKPDKILFDYALQESVYKGGPLAVEQKMTGELYKINLLKKTFPKDIKPDERIKTDKKTQLEITMPSKDVIKVAQHSEAVIRSESLVEIMKGKIHCLINKQIGKKFKVKTPIVTTSVRGTEYILIVEDDGTSTLIVLEGEVEFSDKQGNKTVLVKKNQQSVVKPGEMSSEPIDINPYRIPKWWD